MADHDHSMHDHSMHDHSMHNAPALVVSSTSAPVDHSLHNHDSHEGHGSVAENMVHHMMSMSVSDFLKSL